MLDRAKKSGNPYYFSSADVVDVCSFVEKLPHAAGTWNTEHILLEPPQIWWLASIYGFRRRATGARLVRWVLLLIPRKNAKSALAAALVLYGLTCEGEKAPDIYIGAATEKQAGKVFNPAKRMVELDSDLREQFGLEPRARQIRCASSGGRVEIIASISDHEDGHNPHMVVLEELHAVPADIYEVMRSAFGARKNPLFLQITTAGRVAAGLWWEQIKYAQRILNGSEVADHVFSALYTIDEEDKEDILTERVAIKANPMWGVSVDPEQVREIAKEAKASPSRRADYSRTRVNVVSNADDRLVQQADWDACKVEGLSLSDFEGCRAWIGADLARRSDFTALAIIIEWRKKLAGFGRFYLPDQAKMLTVPEYQGMCAAWSDACYLNLNPGPATDLEAVEQDIREICGFLDVQAVVFDRTFANEIMRKLERDGYTVVDYPQRANTMSDPTDDLVARIEGRQFAHGDNPIINWMVANVVGHRNRRDYVLPVKEGPDQKIDWFVAAVMANGCRIGGEIEAPPVSPYSQRGLLGIERGA